MYNGMIPRQLYMYYNAPRFEDRPAKPMPKSGFDGKRTGPATRAVSKRNKMHPKPH